jgi:hypothetical protein
MKLELDKAKNDGDVMKRELESTQEVLKEAQDVKKATDFRQEFLESLIKKSESDMHEARTQLDTQCQNLACTRDLLNKTQKAKQQVDLNYEVLGGANQILEHELEKLSKDRQSLQQELVRLRQEHRLKDETSQKVLGKAQAAMKSLEIEKDSSETITRKLELELEAVRKDRDSKENKLANLQRLLEQAKGAADSNEASICTAHRKWDKAIDQLNIKDEMLGVASEELFRLRTKLDASTKMDAKKFEELKKEFDGSEKRSHQVTDLLSNTMDELIEERRNRRVMEKRIEDLQANCASEKVLRKRTESQVKRLDAELTAARNVPAVDEWDF